MGSFTVMRKHPLILEDLHFKQKRETTMVLLVMSTSFWNITFQAGYVHILKLLILIISIFSGLYIMFERCNLDYSQVL